jgi:hypothetical protein
MYRADAVSTILFALLLFIAHAVDANRRQQPAQQPRPVVTNETQNKDSA